MAGAQAAVTGRGLAPIFPGGQSRAYGEEAVADTNSDRFLVAFAQAEEAMKRLLGTSSRDSFRWMVRQAAKRNAVVRGVEDDLLEYADLRNAIVHDRGGGYVIAEPHPATVERLETIVALLFDPPRIDQTMSRPVVTCSAEDPIGEAAERMVDGGFTRLPVYEADALVGLLTAHSLARWIATKLAGPLDTLQEEPVGGVLEYGNGAKHFALVARDRRVTDVVQLFTEATERGRPLEAVLVTATGSATERLLGIVTVQDLPRLYAAVAP